MASRILCVCLLALSLPLPAAAQVVNRVAPDGLRRGAATEVIVRGSDLGAATGAAISGGDLVVGGFAGSDDLLRFDVGVGDSAALGARDLTIDGLGLLLDEAISVIPGPVVILGLTPTSGARGETVTMQVNGSNLDTVTAWSFGPSVDVDSWDADTPTRGRVTVTVGAAAFSGPRAVTAIDGEASTVLEAGFSVTGGEPALDGVFPGFGVRGDTLEVDLRGENLDVIDAVSFGSRVTIDAFAVASPTRATATITVGADAASGPRAVVMRSGETPWTFAEAFTVRRGALAVSGVRPERVRQGDVTFLTVEGENLDGLHTFEAGEGVRATGFTSAPRTATVDIEVDDDAAIGFRDLTIVGPAGSMTVPDGLVVGAYVRPPVDVRFEDEVTLGDTQLGAYRRSGIALENRGSIEEVAQLVATDGDVDLFALIDETGGRTSDLAVLIGVGELVTVPLEFIPLARGRTGAEFTVSVRDGEPVGTFLTRGNGIRGDLLFSLDSPFDFGFGVSDADHPLLRLDTLSRDGVDAGEVAVLGYSLRLTADGAPVEEPDALIAIELVSTTGDDLLWGTTEIVWSIDAAPGRYEGTLVLETDAETAPSVEFGFMIDLEPNGGDTGPADTGGDAGVEDATPDAADAEVDVPAEVDAGASDLPTPDARPDTAPDASADAADTGSEDATDDSSGSGGRRKRRGCSVGANPSGGLWAMLLVALVPLVRTRRRTH